MYDGSPKITKFESTEFTEGGLPRPLIAPMERQRHAGFKWVNQNEEPNRPVQVAMTQAQFDILYGKAMALDVQPPRSYLCGRQTLVAQMIRDIADGKLEVVRPTPASMAINGRRA